MGLLTRIEDIISIPIDAMHNRKGFHPVDLIRLALRCMERGCRKGIKRIYAPNRFRVLLNPHDYGELSPFLNVIRSDISGELRRVTDERDYLMAGDLSVEIEADIDSVRGLPQVKGFMHGDSEPESTVCLSDPADPVPMEPDAGAPEPETVVGVAEEPGSADEETDTATVPEADIHEASIREKASPTPENHDALSRHLAEISLAAELLSRHLETLRQGIATPQPDRLHPEEPPKQIAAAPCNLSVSKLPVCVKPSSFRFEFTGLETVLHFEAGGVWVENLSQNPGVTVNGHSVFSKQLQHGDRLQLGPVHADVCMSGPVRHFSEENEEMDKLLEILDLSA